jgi:hypothetical protein
MMNFKPNKKNYNTGDIVICISKKYAYLEYGDIRVIHGHSRGSLYEYDLGTIAWVPHKYLAKLASKTISSLNFTIESSNFYGD